MKLRKLLLLAVLPGFMAIGLSSCKKKPAEADVKSAVEQAAGTGVTVDVDGNTATLSGMVMDEAAKSSAESAARSVEGVENVVNNITVQAPPPPPMPSATDQAMQGAVNSVVSAYPGVMASVSDSVVTLTGTLAKGKLRELMTAINDLKPKRVDNQITTN